MHYSGRAVQQWPDRSRNLAVALQSKSRGDVYMLEEFCKQPALEALLADGSSVQPLMLSMQCARN